MKPPTRGDKLDEVMRLRAQTAEAAATIMGVEPAEVLLWVADRQVPEQPQQAALLAYLDIDERQLRGLLLRSQMRRTQWRIRD